LITANRAALFYQVQGKIRESTTGKSPIHVMATQTTTQALHRAQRETFPITLIAR